MKTETRRIVVACDVVAGSECDWAHQAELATFLTCVTGRDWCDPPKNPLADYEVGNFEVFNPEDSAAMLAAVPQAPPPVPGGGYRRPEDLSRDELVSIVKGLREVMYRRPADWDGGDETPPPDNWEPDAAVNGGELVQWVAYELKRAGLVPDARPLTIEEG